MPEFNLIQRPDLILRIQKFLGIRQAHIVPTLSPTVQCVVIAGDVSENLEDQTALRYSVLVQFGPDVANQSLISLENPVTPVGIAPVNLLPRRVVTLSAPAGNCFLVHAVPGMALIGGGVRGRPYVTQSGDISSAGRVASAAGALPGSPNWFVIDQRELDLEGFVIRPGQCMRMASVNINTTLTAVFEWDEVASPSGSVR